MKISAAHSFNLADFQLIQAAATFFSQQFPLINETMKKDFLINFLWKGREDGFRRLFGRITPRSRQSNGKMSSRYDGSTETAAVSPHSGHVRAFGNRANAWTRARARRSCAWPSRRRTRRSSAARASRRCRRSTGTTWSPSTARSKSARGRWMQALRPAASQPLSTTASAMVLAAPSARLSP